MVRGFRRHRYGRDLHQSRTPTPPQGQRDDTKEMNRKKSNRFRRFRNTPPPSLCGGDGRLLLLLDVLHAMRRTLGRRRGRSCFHQKGVFLATNLIMGDVLSNEHTTLSERKTHIEYYYVDLFRLSLENPVRMCSILSSSLLALHRLHLHFYTRSLLSVCAYIYIYARIVFRLDASTDGRAPSSRPSSSVIVVAYYTIMNTIIHYCHSISHGFFCSNFFALTTLRFFASLRIIAFLITSSAMSSLLVVFINAIQFPTVSVRTFSLL